MSDPATDSTGQIVQPRDITHIGGTAQTGRNWSTDMSKLDIALSALRDAIEGSGDKNFTTLETLLATALIRDITKWGGTALTGRNISADMQVLTDLKKGTQASDVVATETANVLKTISVMQGIDSGGDLVRPRLWNSADGQADTYALVSLLRHQLYNGATWDRARSNQEGEILASAARTASTESADQINYNARGVIVFVNVTANPGGGETLSPFISCRSDSGAGVSPILLSGTNITGNGGTAYMVYPGITNAGGVTNIGSIALPRRWYFRMAHSASGSWTYQVWASPIL